MIDNKNAKVTVDLSPLDKGTVNCDATVQTGNLNQAEKVSVIIAKLNADDQNRLMQGQIEVRSIFGSPKVTGLFDDGSTFETEITFIKKIDFNRDSAVVHCFIGPSFVIHVKSTVDCRFWKFRLANLRLDRGDLFTHQPPPEETVPLEKIQEYHALIAESNKSFGKPPLTMTQIKDRYKNFKIRLLQNRISFIFAGRTWLLDDDLLGRWERDLNKIAIPVVSGTLSTEILEGDSDKIVQELATDICNLLTFALARDVKWIEVGCFAEEGKSHGLFQRSPGLLPFNQHGSPTIDNWEGGNLKGFLETAATPLNEAKEWWSVSIGLLMQARGAKYLEVKCSLLNTLLDRISSKVNGDHYGNEIDACLDTRLDRKWFRWLLHRLMRTLSKNWEQHRTDSLCDNVIKGWNAEPSFPDKVIRTCDHLGIPPLSRTRIGFRHKLIHSGEMNKKLNTTEQKLEYLFGIEAVVLLMMVRMLGFSGHIYLQSSPPDPKPVSEFLAVQEVGA
jgi:hypothetical protein